MTHGGGEGLLLGALDSKWSALSSTHWCILSLFIALMLKRKGKWFLLYLQGFSPSNRFVVQAPFFGIDFPGSKSAEPAWKYDVRRQSVIGRLGDGEPETEGEFPHNNPALMVHSHQIRYARQSRIWCFQFDAFTPCAFWAMDESGLHSKYMWSVGRTWCVKRSKR